MKRTRNTFQRRAVLQAVRDRAGFHPTAGEVWAHVRETHPQLSLATVYRALHALVEQREIGETHGENGTRYDASPLPHHHVECRLCGTLADVAAPLPPSVVRALRAASPFPLLDLDALRLTGVCASCAQTTPVPVVR